MKAKCIAPQTSSSWCCFCSSEPSWSTFPLKSVHDQEQCLGQWFVSKWHSLNGEIQPGEPSSHGGSPCHVFSKEAMHTKSAIHVIINKKMIHQSMPPSSIAHWSSVVVSMSIAGTLSKARVRKDTLTSLWPCRQQAVIINVFLPFSFMTSITFSSSIGPAFAPHLFTALFLA